MTERKRATIVTVACVIALGFLVAWGQPETDAIALVNLERESHGLQPLLPNASLMHAAEGHSLDMATHDFLGHTGSDGSAPWERMRRDGYTDWFAAGEVIVIAATPGAAVYHLMQDQAHRDILLGPAFNEIGVGYIHKPDSSYRHYGRAPFV
jgi:uncharacterized protein YkwD